MAPIALSWAHPRWWGLPVRVVMGGEAEAWVAPPRVDYVHVVDFPFRKGRRVELAERTRAPGAVVRCNLYEGMTKA